MARRAPNLPFWGTLRQQMAAPERFPQYPYVRLPLTKTAEIGFSRRDRSFQRRERGREGVFGTEGRNAH